MDDGNSSTTTANNAIGQRRRPNYFFRTESSIGAEPTPRSEAGSVVSEGLWLVLWSLIINGIVALFLLALVQSLFSPILVAVLELTPSARMNKLLAALLTIYLFVSGLQGGVVLLISLTGATIGMNIAQWDEGLIPLFLTLYVGFFTFFRLGGSNGICSSASAAAGGMGGLKSISENSPGRDGWSPVTRWKLWGA